MLHRDARIARGSRVFGQCWLVKVWGLGAQGSHMGFGVGKCAFVENL